MVRIKRKIKYLILCIFAFALLDNAVVFAKEYTLCNGKEFNSRVKSFLSGGDKNATSDYQITIFERGYNPPSDKAYYVDISEDKDGSVIAYQQDNTLYWYSDSYVILNKDCSYMFEKFYRLRNVNLSDFLYLDGLNDTSYMFSECRYLHTIKFKTNAQITDMKKKDRWLEPSSIQGMFFSCQSLKAIDLSMFKTLHVETMTEVFFKCYNLRNIYIAKEAWDMSNIYFFERTFAQCHCLRTNFGRKATDISEDDYETYCVAGEEKVEGLLKDVNTTYTDYGESISNIPIDGINAEVETPETTVIYADEPEGDGGTGDGTGSGEGTGETGTGQPYVGNKDSGYYAQKETTGSPDVLGTTTEYNPAMASTQPAVVEGETNVEVKESVVVNESTTTLETTQVIESAEVPETHQKKIMELDDYLKEQGIDGAEGSANGAAGEKVDNSKFLIFALVVSILAILLLVGMVIYLFRDKKESAKDKNDPSI